MTSQFRLDQTLGAMGMTDAFNPDRANFAGMDGRTNWLYIGAVIHKAFVDVNEEGTEAAAATAVVMRIKMAKPAPPPTFRADHPFLFLIRDNGSGSILFMGRVSNPA
jgi:serpin B